MTYTGNPTHVSGRTTAIAVAADGQTVYLGTAGGGVGRPTDITAAHPNWHPIGADIPSSAIGSLTLANGTLYVGTGEPNGSADSEAGLGLFESTDGGNSFTEVDGFRQYSQDRSISLIAVDPTDAQHLLVGTMLGRHGSSSVNGGRMTPPGAAPIGLYETTDGGATWTQVINEPQDPVDRPLGQRQRLLPWRCHQGRVRPERPRYVVRLGQRLRAVPAALPGSRRTRASTRSRRPVPPRLSSTEPDRVRRDRPRRQDA